MSQLYDWNFRQQLNYFNSWKIIRQEQSVVKDIHASEELKSNTISLCRSGLPCCNSNRNASITHPTTSMESLLATNIVANHRENGPETGGDIAFERMLEKQLRAALTSGLYIQTTSPVPLCEQQLANFFFPSVDYPTPAVDKPEPFTQYIYDATKYRALSWVATRLPATSPVFPFNHNEVSTRATSYSQLSLTSGLEVVRS